MDVPHAVQQLIDEVLAEMIADAAHQLSPFKRRTLYDVFQNEGTPRKNALRWLEILTVRHVLPLWTEQWPYSWDDYPRPAELLQIREDKLRGLLNPDEWTDAESLAAEMVSLTGEAKGSPLYPAWCIFEAAVCLFFRYNFDPDENLTDEAVKNNFGGKADVAHFALIAYAGRIQPEITDEKTLHALWKAQFTDEPEPSLPRITLILDADASLKFWEWWLREAIPEAWKLAKLE